MGRKSEKDDQLNPVGGENIQRELRLAFYKRWVMFISGILLAAVPIVTIIREDETYLPELLPFLLVGTLGIVLILLAAGTLRRTKQVAALPAETVIKEAFGADSRYDASGHIPEECIAATDFVEDYEHIYGSDLVRGQYRGIPILFSNVRLTRTDRECNSETRKQEVDVFKGYWLVADFDRELAPPPLTVLEGRSGDGSIPTESEAFNGRFSVFCTDAHAAFYILTPHFMERLAAVDEAADGRSYFHFSKNRMQIAVETGRDLFEAGTFKAPNADAMRERFRGELGRLTAVLDEMLRHERLFGSRED